MANSEESKWDQWSRAWAARDYKTLTDIATGANAYNPIMDMSQRVVNRVLAGREGQVPVDDGVSFQALEEAAKVGAFVPAMDSEHSWLRRRGDPTYPPKPMSGDRLQPQTTLHESMRTGADLKELDRARFSDATKPNRPSYATADDLSAPKGVRDLHSAKSEVAATSNPRFKESGAPVRTSSVREPMQYESAVETRFTGKPLENPPKSPVVGEMGEMGAKPLPDEMPATRGAARKGGGRGGSVPAPLLAALGIAAAPAAAMMELAAGTRPDGTIIHQSRLLGRPMTRADLSEDLVQALDEDPDMENWLLQSGFLSRERQPRQDTSADIATASYSDTGR